MSEARFVPFTDRYQPALPPEEAAAALFEILRRRRSVRMFDDRPVSRQTIEWLVRCAHTAPSGANKQPWRFVCVQDPAVKARIRAGAEAEEREFYARRANEQWLADLAPLGTDEHKEFLTTAPWLVVVFQLTHLDDGSQVYYLKESVGLACGLFLAAAQHAGLATLTHTPSPMAFLNEVLGRPKHERPFLLIPVGYASADCEVPAMAIGRRPLDEVMVVI
ncbi:MAG: nitroreductase family protein [Planctomycetes bacterium]|nr:nitroreductase family protein [Planctomycetota bacterium]MCB9886030.1 nitroreductase family protein [Planctomycetota bacterium]